MRGLIRTIMAQMGYTMLTCKIMSFLSGGSIILEWQQVKTAVNKSLVGDEIDYTTGSY